MVGEVGAMGPEASAAFKLAAKAGVMHATDPVGVLLALDDEPPFVQGGHEDRDGVDETTPGLDGALSTASLDGAWYERSQPRAFAEPTRPARFVHACDDEDVTCSEAGRSALVASGSPFDDTPPAGGDERPGAASDEAPLPALEFDAPEYVGQPLSLDDDWLSSLRSLSRFDSIFNTTTTKNTNN